MCVGCVRGLTVSSPPVRECAIQDARESIFLTTVLSASPPATPVVPSASSSSSNSSSCSMMNSVAVALISGVALGSIALKLIWSHVVSSFISSKNPSFSSERSSVIAHGCTLTSTSTAQSAILLRNFIVTFVMESKSIPASALEFATTNGLFRPVRAAARTMEDCDGGVSHTHVCHTHV